MPRKKVEDHGLPRNWPDPLGWLRSYIWDETWHPQYLEGFRRGVAKLDELLSEWWTVDITQARRIKEGNLHKLIDLIGGDKLADLLGISLSPQYIDAFKLGLGPWKFHLMGGAGRDLNQQLTSLWLREIEWRQGLIRLAEPVPQAWGPLDADDAAADSADRCPRCDSNKTQKIVYGMPDLELWNLAATKGVRLGGPVVGPESPNRYCVHCHGQWVEGGQVVTDPEWISSQHRPRAKPLRMLGRVRAEGPIRHKPVVSGWTHFLTPDGSRDDFGETSD